MVYFKKSELKTQKAGNQMATRLSVLFISVLSRQWWARRRWRQVNVYMRMPSVMPVIMMPVGKR